MQLNRRQFLATSSALLAAASAGVRRVSAQGAAQAAPQGVPPTAFTPLRRSVGYFTGQGGTIGWFIDKTGVVVVDAQMPATAKLCLDGIVERAQGHGIDWLVNTHHHADHTGGNPVFRPAVKKILAHANVPGLQKAAAERAVQQGRQPGEQIYADVTYATTWREAVGDEVMALQHYGPAHTGGDSVVTFEKAHVVHMGDLIFNRRHPVIDRPGGASIANWITTLEKVMADHGRDTVYIFGHAGQNFPVTGGSRDLAYMRDYLSALIDYVRAGLRAGKSREEIIKSTDVLKGFPDHGPLTERVLTPACDELLETR